MPVGTIEIAVLPGRLDLVYHVHKLCFLSLAYESFVEEVTSQSGMRSLQ